VVMTRRLYTHLCPLMLSAALASCSGTDGASNAVNTSRLDFQKAEEIKAEEIQGGEIKAREIKGQKQVVKLVLLDEEDNPKLCSSVILSPTRALTAQHCFDEFVFTSYAEYGEQRYEIKKVTRHPETNTLANKEVRNDLAVIEFDRPLPIEAPCLFAQSAARVGETVEFFGFGPIDENYSNHGVIRSGKMRISSVDKSFIRANYDGTGENTCHGDSGGPVYRRTDTGLELLGIVSSGSKDDCGPGDTSVFINLQSKSAKKFLKRFLP